MTTKSRAEHAARADAALAIAKRIFSEIQSRFPHLQMIDDTHEAVHLSMTLPVQPGLKYEVNLNLQNIDELHFSVSNFWCEWFPCTKSERANDYTEAVLGFISGDYRIVEYYFGSKFMKSQLKCPQGKICKTVATYTRISAMILLLIPQKWRESVVISNK